MSAYRPIARLREVAGLARPAIPAELAYAVRLTSNSGAEIVKRDYCSSEWT